MKERKYKLDRENYIKFLVAPKVVAIVFWVEIILGILGTFVAFPLLNNNLVVGIAGIVTLVLGIFLGLVEAIVSVVTNSKVPTDLDKEK